MGDVLGFPAFLLGRGGAFVRLDAGLFGFARPPFGVPNPILEPLHTIGWFVSAPAATHAAVQSIPGADVLLIVILIALSWAPGSRTSRPPARSAILA